MLRKRLRDLSIIQNPLNSEETNSDQQIAIRSSNVSNTVDEPVKIQIENDRRRKTRRCTLLKDLYDLNSVERAKVSRNSHGQPIRSKARLLAGYLGIIAQNANLLSINYKSWHHMPDSNENQALDNIKERFALEISDNYVKKALAKKWRDHKSTLKKEYFKKICKPRREIAKCPAENTKEKLKDKRTEYEAMASSDSFVNLEDIDNRIITEVLGPKRLRDQMAQMQASIVEQIAQLKAEAASREAEAQRKYDKFQLQLKVEAAAREAEATKKYDELQLQL
ncbi:hypothetical protein J1N35_025733 [Gossypium stocksii]|uniref:Uncharacterized protein n=1 Tax=Gossypium stocksii TaxID=47602 RepID=A0A9D3V7G1_9ROSI|nr:hypothetical protein J1N35_025733 [Gossypium stocksii]